MNKDQIKGTSDKVTGNGKVQHTNSDLTSSASHQTKKPLNEPSGGSQNLSSRTPSSSTNMGKVSGKTDHASHSKV